ncbi:MAG: hypothetical protein ACR2NP_00050, partial [Pirellulaceae bacterium]
MCEMARPSDAILATIKTPGKPCKFRLNADFRRLCGLDLLTGLSGNSISKLRGSQVVSLTDHRRMPMIKGTEY